MKSKKLLSDLLVKTDINEVANLSGGKWPKWQCVLQAAACAVGPLCGHYSEKICRKGGIMDQNCS